MFGAIGMGEAMYWMEQNERDRKQREREQYDISKMRGPMIEADFDWTAPIPGRQMVDGDL